MFAHNYMKDNKHDIPQLRFPEFSRKWEEKKLGEIFREVSEKVEDQQLETYSITAGYGFISQKEKFGKDISGNQNPNYTALKPNHFSYNKGNSKTYKYGCVYINKTEKIIAVPNVFISFELKDNSMYGEFFAKLFEAHYLDRGLRRIISSSARMDGLLNVNKKNFFNLKIFITDSEEQERIAEFLTAVDKRIEKLQEKKILLEDYKKGVMQKIFSQQTRFTDESNNPYPDWEEKKLGDVCEINKGEQLNKELLYEGGKYPAYSGGINESGFTDKFNSLKNTVAISEGGNSCGFVNYIKTKFWSGGHCYTLEILDEKNSTQYIYQNLKFLQKSIMRLRVGSGLPNIQKKDLKTFKINLPHPKEQQKIADFLTSIDKKIDVVADEIEQSKQYKKGLLQQMFV